MSGRTHQQEIRALLAREQVRALVDHYVTTIDEPCSFDGSWARSLFTEDVRLEHEIAVVNGIEEVAAAHRMVLGRWARTFRFSANHRVEVEDERAYLSARLMAIHVHPGENPPDALVAANHLETDAVLTGEGWRFERFAPRTLWRSGQPAAQIEADDR